MDFASSASPAPATTISQPIARNWVSLAITTATWWARVGLGGREQAARERVLADDRPEAGRSVERPQRPPRVAGDVGLHERHAEAEEREPGGGEPELGGVGAAAGRGDPLGAGSGGSIDMFEE